MIKLSWRHTQSTTPNNRVDTLIRSAASISPASHLHHFFLFVCCWAANESGTGWWHHLVLPPGCCCCCRTVPDLRDPVGAVGGGAFSCHTQESRLCCVQRFFVPTIVAGAQRSRQFTRSCSTERDDAAQCSNWRRQVTTDDDFFDLFDVPQLPAKPRETNFFPERRTKEEEQDGQISH